MTFADVPEVIVDPDGGYKFIVAKVTDRNGVEKLVVRAKEKHCDYHDDILDWLRSEVGPIGLRAYCIGGGELRSIPKPKLFIYGMIVGLLGKNQTASRLLG